MESEPAEAGPEAAALASQPDGDAPAAATAADADALPTNTGAAKKNRKGSNRATAGLEAELAEDPQSSAMPVTKCKKKKKANKAKPSDSVPPLDDDAAAPDDEETVEPQADEVTQQQLMAI